MTESWWTEATPDASWFASPGAPAEGDDGRPSFVIPAVLDLVVGELLEAVPELREHLLAAAGELLGAARAVLDAAERVLDQQRADPS